MGAAASIEALKPVDASDIQPVRITLFSLYQNDHDNEMIFVFVVNVAELERGADSS